MPVKKEIKKRSKKKLENSLKEEKKHNRLINLTRAPYSKTHPGFLLEN